MLISKISSTVSQLITKIYTINSDSFLTLFELRLSITTQSIMIKDMYVISHRESLKDQSQNEMFFSFVIVEQYYNKDAKSI